MWWVSWHTAKSKLLMRATMDKEAVHCTKVGKIFPTQLKIGTLLYYLVWGFTLGLSQIVQSFAQISFGWYTGILV